jgi:hypothetical protein
MKVRALGNLCCKCKKQQGSSSTFPSFPSDSFTPSQVPTAAALNAVPAVDPEQSAAASKPPGSESKLTGSKKSPVPFVEQAGISDNGDDAGSSDDEFVSPWASEIAAGMPPKKRKTDNSSAFTTPEKVPKLVTTMPQSPLVTSVGRYNELTHVSVNSVTNAFGDLAKQPDDVTSEGGYFSHQIGGASVFIHGPPPSAIAAASEDDATSGDSDEGAETNKPITYSEALEMKYEMEIDHEDQSIVFVRAMQ